MNIIEIAMCGFFSLIGIIIVLGTIYLLYRNNKIKKYGVPVKLKVKDCKENKNQEGIRVSYITTFEFVDNGEKKEDIIQTSKKFKIGTTQKGILMKEGTKNVISVGGEGFYLNTGWAIWLIIFGLMMAWSPMAAALNFPAYTIVIPLLSLFLYTFVYLWLGPTLLERSKKSKNKKKAEINAIYHDNIDDEYSTVSPNLVRYIPKNNKQNKKNNEDDSQKIVWIPSIFFFALGIMIIYMGVIGFKYIYKIQTSWPLTTAIVTNVYSYENKEGEKDEKFTCSYIVNNNTYEIEQNGDSVINNYKKGEEIKLYYNPDNPSEVELRDGIYIALMEFPFGAVFMYVSFVMFKEANYKNNLIIKKGDE